MKVNLLPISFVHKTKDLLFYFRSQLYIIRSLQLYNISLNDSVQQNIISRSTRNSCVLDLSFPKYRPKFVVILIVYFVVELSASSITVP